ncbi:MAG: YfcE family phosphodiesterase [Deferribacterota bacterium]|nr:YfcE family phosphodiesterase [Deferribacterota bacterium]
MLIGVLSDTHDAMEKINKSIAIFNSKKVEYVIHCGDIVSPFAAKPLENLNCDYIGVFGNNDGDLQLINHVTSGRFHKMPKKIVLDGKQIIIFHEQFIIDDIDENIDVVLYGHTHNKDYHKKGNQIIVNPGTVSGYISGLSTICTIDLATMDVEFIEI